jgi:hypothetical protein
VRFSNRRTTIGRRTEAGVLEQDAARNTRAADRTGFTISAVQ